MDYITECSKLNYGMTYKQIHELACGCDRILQCKFPSSWIDNKFAGFDWLQGFMKRHKNFMLHRSEYTSLFRATAFNKTNVTEFCDSYECALKSWKFTADREYNIDKTRVSTVVQSPNTVGQIGRKQDGQAVSGERGTMITVCHYHHHHHKHQGLDPLIRSISTVTAARTKTSSVFQLFSFLVGCSGMISKPTKTLQACRTNFSIKSI